VKDAISSVRNDPQGVYPSSGSIRQASVGTPVPAEDGRRVPFLTRTIPAEHLAPQIHNELINLMAMRHQFQEDIEEALQDGEEELMRRTEQRYHDCNTRMHVIYEQYIVHNKEGLTPTASGYDSSPVSMTRSAGHGTSTSTGVARDLPNTPPQQYVDVDDLPVLGSYSPTRLKPATASNAHSPSSTPFAISFVYLEEDISMNVWNAMPLFHLFTFAWQWLLQEFEFHGAVDDIELVRRDGTGDETYLPRGGYVQDVSIYADEELAIEIVELVPHMHHPVTPYSDPRPLRYNQPRRSIVERHAPAPYEPQEDDRIESKSYDKIRQTFKCPKFVGQAKDWKAWNKGLMRFLAIWDLDYVLGPEFMETLPLSKAQFRDNKLVYYLIEDAVQGSLLASSYVHKAPLYNGFEAYYTLLDGFVFAGSTTASLLLNELTNFRFLKDESPTAMVLRLEELFQDLKLLPGDSAMVFNDTQCIGYLLGVLRHEPAWATVHSYIQSGQIKGDMTFSKACDELRVRCEATRAHEVMDRPVGRKQVRAMVAQTNGDLPESLTPEKVLAYISTMAMKHNTDDKPGSDKTGSGRGKTRTLYPCLAKDCTEQTYFPLCGNHYHSLIAAKLTSVELRQQYGNATYNADTKMVVYPEKIPAERKPSNIKRVRAAAASTASAN
jgi:hypothetical protein